MKEIIPPKAVKRMLESDFNKGRRVAKEKPSGVSLTFSAEGQLDFTRRQKFLK